MLGNIYKSVLKPFLFKIDAERVHEIVTMMGEYLEEQELLNLLSYKNSKLSQNICGINFANPIGLAAGFDYDAHLARVLNRIGFGFNTVGTVTAKPYKGNLKPRLGRLPKSQSLFVNKGFRNDGVERIIERLESKALKKVTLGVSVGSENLNIDDILFVINSLKNMKVVSYLELNISCPNLPAGEGLKDPKKFESLIKNIKFDKPVFVKMPNEIDLEKIDILVKLGIKYGMSGFVLSNLVKDRQNKFLNKSELKIIENLKGNFSGKPTFENSNKLISHVYKKFGKYTKIIGCGGVFSAEDAYLKIKLGASLVEMITGMIYEGPQVIGEINRGLVKLLEKDGYSNISDAVGTWGSPPPN